MLNDKCLMINGKLLIRNSRQKLWNCEIAELLLKGIAPLTIVGTRCKHLLLSNCPLPNCQIAPLPIAKLPIAILLLKGIAPLTIVGTGRTAGIYYCQIAHCQIAHCQIAHCLLRYCPLPYCSLKELHHLQSYGQAARIDYCPIAYCDIAHCQIAKLPNCPLPNCS